MDGSQSLPTVSRSRWDLGAVRSEPLGPSDDWQYIDFASAEVIEGTLEAYKRICHNTCVSLCDKWQAARLIFSYPYFHWPTFWLQVQDGLYRTDRAFSAAVMAACAMASARIRDGALDRFPNPPIFPIETAVSLSEEFYRAALRAIPHDLTVAVEFNYKRAKALLCAVAIQFGYARTFSVHLGDYITMCSIDGFHNEARWPAGCNAIEVQERRRLVCSFFATSRYKLTYSTGRCTRWTSTRQSHGTG